MLGSNTTSNTSSREGRGHGNGRRYIILLIGLWRCKNHTLSLTSMSFHVSRLCFLVAPPADSTDAGNVPARKKKKGMKRETDSQRFVAAAQKIKHVFVSA